MFKHDYRKLFNLITKHFARVIMIKMTISKVKCLVFAIKLGKKHFWTKTSWAQFVRCVISLLNMFKTDAVRLVLSIMLNSFFIDVSFNTVYCMAKVDKLSSLSTCLCHVHFRGTTVVFLSYRWTFIALHRVFKGQVYVVIIPPLPTLARNIS